jgi:hypothetical protein
MDVQKLKIYELLNAEKHTILTSLKYSTISLKPTRVVLAESVLQSSFIDFKYVIFISEGHKLKGGDRKQGRAENLLFSNYVISIVPSP